MFVLTETAKAVQNSEGLGTVLGIIAAVCIVLLVCVVVDGRR